MVISGCDLVINIFTALRIKLQNVKWNMSSSYNVGINCKYKNVTKTLGHYCNLIKMNNGYNVLE